ncbi:hypothetical protein [Streptomyces sp. I05A-00742]|uniref:hypothetical protein n=1 Tax=Streptomyces sp. I05A-00742 TaxID=2732853 RepID=UPI0014896F75|nr:hypothetical protein [Streptomyces sp. I05A-00742]
MPIRRTPVLLGCCVVLGTVFLGAAEVYKDRRRKREWYESTFASFEELRAAVDEPALRRTRDERGTAAALLQLQRTYPSLPIAVAARLIKSL